MRQVLGLIAIGSLLAGYVSLPSAPSIMALPGRDRSYADFQRDDAYCRQEASRQQADSPEMVTASSAAKAGIVTGLIGAAAGAAIGAVTGSPGTGAAIGGASGGVLGAAGGAGAGQRAAQQMQQRYNSVFAQCMYGQGHAIPSMPVMSR
jgi:outer membrane lipoprotein SlyB